MVHLCANTYTNIHMHIIHMHMYIHAYMSWHMCERKNACIHVVIYGCMYQYKYAYCLVIMALASIMANN